MKTEALKQSELKALAEILERMGHMFSERSCNDYWIPNTAANREIIGAVGAFNEDSDSNGELDPSHNLYVHDHRLMLYFADRCKMLAKPAGGANKPQPLSSAELFVLTGVLEMLVRDEYSPFEQSEGYQDPAPSPSKQSVAFFKDVIADGALWDFLPWVLGYLVRRCQFIAPSGSPLLELKDQICILLQEQLKHVRVFLRTIDQRVLIGLLTRTDAERDQLQADENFWAVAASSAKPQCEKAGMSFEGFTIASQHEIDTNHGGVWLPFLSAPVPVSDPMPDIVRLSTHNKFWEAEVRGRELRLRYGRHYDFEGPTISEVKLFADAQAAYRERTNIIQEKEKKAWGFRPPDILWERVDSEVLGLVRDRVADAEVRRFECIFPQEIFGIVTETNTERELLMADERFQEQAISIAKSRLGEFGYTPELAFQSKQTLETELRGKDWIPENMDKEWD